MKSIKSTDQVYDIPYVTHGSTSDYIDLRSQPTRIDELPELNQEPRLKALVSLLNDPSGMFMTQGCWVRKRRPGLPGSTVIPIPEEAENAPYWYSSYVVFSFSHLNQNKKEHYEAIHQCYPSDRNESNTCFELGPVYFCTPTEQESGLANGTALDHGTVCTLWASGWGGSVRAADDRWSGGID